MAADSTWHKHREPSVGESRRSRQRRFMPDKAKAGLNGFRRTAFTSTAHAYRVPLVGVINAIGPAVMMAIDVPSSVQP